MKQSELQRIKDELIESLDEKIDEAIPHLSDDADGFHIRVLADYYTRMNRNENFKIVEAQNDILGNHNIQL